jgi:hypothetical protein
MTGVIAGMIGGMVTVPSEPTVLSATSHVNTQSVLTWTAPARNGGSSITDYVVQYSTSATFASAVTTFTDGVNASTGATVTGLTNGTTYYFRVAAVNSVGTGAYSTISAGAVPSTIPSVPATPTVTALDAGDTINWTAPATGGRAITGYVYKVSTNNGAYGAEVSVAANVFSYATLNQYSASTFKIQVRAVNANGSSGFSTVSANTAVWVSEAGTVAHPTACVTDPCTCAAPTCASCGSCPACAACDCGTSTSSGSAGTNTATAGTSTLTAPNTNTRTCYRWTRGSTATNYIYNQNSTASCDSAYTGCIGRTCSACTPGSCSGCTSTCACSACSGGTKNNVTESYGYNTPFEFVGINWVTEFVPALGAYRAWVYDNYNYSYTGGSFCGGLTAYHLLYQCSVSGVQSVTFVGCY